MSAQLVAGRRRTASSDPPTKSSRAAIATRMPELLPVLGSFPVGGTGGCVVATVVGAGCVVVGATVVVGAGAVVVDAGCVVVGAGVVVVVTTGEQSGTVKVWLLTVVVPKTRLAVRLAPAGTPTEYGSKTE